MAHATWLPRNAEFREVHSILGHSGLSYTGIAYVALMTGFDPLRPLRFSIEMDLPVTASSLPTSNYASTNIGTRGAILAKVSLSPS